MKYFFSIVFIFLLGVEGFAQISRYAPTAVRIGGDPGTLGYMLFSEKRGFFEAEADIDIDKFFIVANYGLSTFKLDEPTYIYENTGTYFKIGPDLNFMNEDPHLNVMFFGLRYATSSFNDKLLYDTDAVIQSETGWPNSRETSSNGNARASWYEMVTGLKIRIVKQLYMGFTMRFKLLMKTKQTEILKPYYIPGFGKNINTSAFGFNYYISYRLPFRTKVIYIDEHKNVIEDKK